MRAVLMTLAEELASTTSDHFAVKFSVDEEDCFSFSRALQARGYEVWAPIPAPDLVIDITAVLEVKRAALVCFETQYAYGDLGHQVFGMNAYRSLLLERSGGYGEAFQRIAV